MNMPTHSTRSSHAGHQHGHDHAHGHQEHTVPSSADDALKDPVCGMTVTVESLHKAGHAGRTHWFCSASCRTKFLTEPQKYMAPVASPPEPTPEAAGTVYTCPMHPEIRQDDPGNCPKCGMTPEPAMPSLDDEANPELADFTHRFWWTLPLTVIVALLAMFGHRLGWMRRFWAPWVSPRTRPAPQPNTAWWG